MGLHRIYDDTAKPLERIAKIPRAVTSWNSEQLESPLVVKSIQAAILKAPDPMALRFPEASDDPPSAEKNSRLPGECLARDFAD